MAILIYGGGAIGLYLAARLADAGNDVIVKVRTKVIAGSGGQPVKLMGADGVTKAYPQVRLVPDLSRVGEISAAIIATKAWQVEEAAADIAPHVGPGTPVVTIQNGVEAPRIAAAQIPGGHVVAGTIVAVVVRHDYVTAEIVGRDATIHLGTFDRQDPTAADTALMDALNRGGVETTWTRDIVSSLWGKLALVAAFGGVGSITGSPVGETRRTPETHDLVERTAREILEVGNAAGARLGEGDIEAVMHIFDNEFQDNTTASMQRDLWEGKPSELHDLTGAVVTNGHRLGVPTPINDTIYAAMVIRENRVRATQPRPVTGAIPVVAG